MKAFFDKLARSLLLPIIVMPVAGLMLRLGSKDLLDIPVISAAGQIVFTNLPLFFAIGVSIVFTKNSNAQVTLSTLLGFLVMKTVILTINPDLYIGVFFGIIEGLISAFLFNKFSKVQLPIYLSFFGGSRFVIIINGVLSVALGFILAYIWFYIDSGIHFIGFAMYKLGNIGLFIYGVLNRLLIPLGLHHIVNNIVWWEFGDFVNNVGGTSSIIHGEITRFFAGDKSAGSYLNMFPVMMFGLPGAAVGIALAAKQKRKYKTFVTLISLAFVGFLTGVTEPIEFTFILIAPMLLLAHAILTGLNLVILNLLEVKTGFTFSAGLIDYIMNYNISTNPLYIIVVGVGLFFIYTLVFYVLVKIFNYPIIGNDDVGDSSNSSNNSSSTDSDLIAKQYVEYLGGVKNIISLSCCTTRLRIVLKDTSLINADNLKSIGALGVVIIDSSKAQVIIGPNVENIKSIIDECITELRMNV